VKTSRELTLTNSIHRCICKESRNIGRENDEKAAEWAAKARPAIENEKQHPLIFWKLDSHVQDVLIFLTFLLSTKHVLQSFSIIVNILVGWKGEALSRSVPGDIEPRYVTERSSASIVESCKRDHI